MKQRIVIRVSMPCERSRSKVMTLAARTDGVISMAIIGDARDMLEVVGHGVDSVRLATCLRKKIGHAEILQVEEVRPDEEEFPMPPLPVAVHQTMPVAVHPPPPQCYPNPGAGGYHYYRYAPPPPPPMVVCEEPTSNCPIM